MNYKLSKSYMAIFIIWMISSFGALLFSFISINYTNINIMLIVKTVTVVLAGLSSVLSIFILMRKLNIISNMLLVIFPIILFLCLICFKRKVDYILYDIYFVLTIIFLIWELFLYFKSKDKKEIVNAIFPLLYSSALMIIKMIELDRYITVLDDNMRSIFLWIGLIAAFISIPFYIVICKNRKPIKKYLGNLILTFFAVFILAFGIPLSMTENINYSFDSSSEIKKQYKVVDKKYSVGGKNSAGNYYLIIIYNNEELKIKLPSEEYDKYNVNENIILSQRSGFFNIPYLEYELND